MHLVQVDRDIEVEQCLQQYHRHDTETESEFYTRLHIYRLFIKRNWDLQYYVQSFYTYTKMFGKSPYLWKRCFVTSINKVNQR